MDPRERRHPFEDLPTSLLNKRLSRRATLRRGGMIALSLPAVSALLAACGGGDDDDEVEEAAETPQGQVVAAEPTATPDAEAQADESTATPEGEAAEDDTPEPAEAEEEGEATEAPSAAGGGTLTYADGTEPPALDPPAQTGPFQHVVRAIYEPMLSNDNEALEPGPRLATNWEVADDNVTWTFTLKEGVLFHDGSEFTSEAVKYSYDRVLDPELPVSRRSLFDVIDETIAEEPYVVTIRTAGVFPDLIFFLCDNITSIVNPTVAEEWGVSDFGLHPSGTGPFMLEEWAQADHITLVRFEDYHDGPANIERLVFRPVPESSSRDAMLRAGEAQIIVSPPTESVEPLQSDPNIEVIIYDSLTQISWEMRVTAPPFDDVRVRHAMNYAVDKQAIIDEIMSGLGQITVTPAPPGVWGAIELEPYSYDPEMAQSLMDEAGYSDGFDGTFFFVPGRWAGDQQVAEATQSYWAQIGARVEITSIDMGSLGEWLSRDPDEMGGAIAGLIRTSTYIDYHIYRLFHPVATTEVASQRSGYVNEEVGSEIDAARATFDLEERAGHYATVQELVWEDAPFVWLFTRQDVIAHQAGLIGLTVLPDGLLLFKDVELPA